MIEISLTRFLDYTIKNGTPKLNSLKLTKKQLAEPYNPATDYYKQIREVIINCHKKGKPLSTITEVAKNVRHAGKRENYPSIASGYKKFIGRKSVKWFTPPQINWEANGVSVSLNPELGLEIDGIRNVIKLYFKSDNPSKYQVRAILSLMDSTLQNSKNNLTMGILNVRKGKLITDNPPDPSFLALMEGEAASIAAIWPSITS
ncbi:hypothetical protein V6x_37440 [Gimesia chilikensis]|uniref:Uncharacterized protein n=1 Tax=Gimesia chilikensis TaxID=2605989 RepID=A0A517WFJ3_9PLAN|nr:hypothetical protein [Gimesia chilikensis]QDU04019.1 hypothetical protein V6x_37440 [Gimesia chilikensis]